MLHACIFLYILDVSICTTILHFAHLHFHLKDHKNKSDKKTENQIVRHHQTRLNSAHSLKHLHCLFKFIVSDCTITAFAAL